MMDGGMLSVPVNRGPHSASEITDTRRKDPAYVYSPLGNFLASKVNGQRQGRERQAATRAETTILSLRSGTIYKQNQKSKYYILQSN